MPSKQKRHRSAITGQFVTEGRANRNPNTTVSETTKPKPKPKKGKGKK